MNITQAPARPPYVEFKRVAKDDMKRTLELGYRVTKDVDMAYIMQPGSKDQVERLATDWLASIKRKSLEQTADAYPQEWVDAFHTKYAAWQNGLEAPVHGTSVREWPILSPAQAENFIALRIVTVEDVAAMTEESMGRFGMGARALRDKAREYLAAKELSADVVKERDELKRQLEEMAERLAALEQSKTEPAKRGRKPKEPE